MSSSVILVMGIILSLALALVVFIYLYHISRSNNNTPTPQPKVSVGSPCLSNTQYPCGLQTNLSCDQSTQTCVSLAGGPCANNNQCLSSQGLICGGYTTTVCVSSLEAGELNQTSKPGGICNDPLTTKVGTDGFTCKLEVGSKCSSSDECIYGVCDPNTFTCSPAAGLGSPCSTNTPCSTGLNCTGGFCNYIGVTNGGVGSYCTNSNIGTQGGCNTGLKCINNFCTQSGGFSLGDDCTDFIECKSGFVNCAKLPPMNGWQGPSPIQTCIWNNDPMSASGSSCPSGYTYSFTGSSPPSCLPNDNQPCAISTCSNSNSECDKSRVKILIYDDSTTLYTLHSLLPENFGRSSEGTNYPIKLSSFVSSNNIPVISAFYSLDKVDPSVNYSFINFSDITVGDKKTPSDIIKGTNAAVVNQIYYINDKWASITDINYAKSSIITGNTSSNIKNYYLTSNDLTIYPCPDNCSTNLNNAINGNDDLNTTIDSDPITANTPMYSYISYGSNNYIYLQDIDFLNGKFLITYNTTFPYNPESGGYSKSGNFMSILSSAPFNPGTEGYNNVDYIKNMNADFNLTTGVESVLNSKICGCFIDETSYVIVKGNPQVYANDGTLSQNQSTDVLIYEVSSNTSDYVLSQKISLDIGIGFIINPFYVRNVIKCTQAGDISLLSSTDSVGLPIVTAQRTGNFVEIAICYPHTEKVSVNMPTGGNIVQGEQICNTTVTVEIDQVVSRRIHYYNNVINSFTDLPGDFSLDTTIKYINGKLHIATSDVCLNVVN